MALRDRILRKLVERGQTKGLSSDAIAAGVREREREKAELKASIARTESWAREPLEERSNIASALSSPAPRPSLLHFIGRAVIGLVYFAIAIFIILGVIGILIFGIRQLF
jgi:hypothetical protein